MNDEKLIECVRKYPILYDSSHIKYMDTILKNEIWNKIGQEINTDGTICETRWNNIRDTYRKSLKKGTTKNGGHGIKTAKTYKRSEQLSFLKKCSLKERESISNNETEEIQHHDNTQHASEVKNDSLLADVDNKIEMTHPKSDQCVGHYELGPPKSYSGKIARKTENQPIAASKLMEYITSKNDHESPLQSEHSVDTFLASIATTLKTLSPYHLHLAKAEIFNTVQKYELVTIMGNPCILRIPNKMTPNSPFDSSSSSSISTQLSPNNVTQNSFQPINFNSSPNTNDLLNYKVMNNNV